MLASPGPAATCALRALSAPGLLPDRARTPAAPQDSGAQGGKSLERSLSQAGWALLPAAALGGVLLQLQQAVLWPWPAVAAAGVLFLVLLAAGCARAWPLSLLAVCAVALGFAYAGLRASHQAAGALPPALEGRELLLTGRIAAMPQATAGGQRLVFEAEQVRLGGADTGWSGRVLLGWWAPAGTQLAPLRAGDRWQLSARLRAPHGPSNPHGFDLELWLWEQGVAATGYVRNGRRDPPPLRLGASGLHPVERLRQGVRDDILARGGGAPSWGVVAALVTGDQRAITQPDWDTFRATGVAHLMSISGLHVTLFAWLAGAGVRRLWRRSTRLCLLLPAAHAALAGGVLMAAGYAVFSGWGVPAQRTVCMLATVAALRMAGLHWPWPQVWLSAAVAVTVADPWALVQPGFWLSFIAVGILFAGGSAPREDSARGGAWARGVAMVREQGVITVALAPLTLLLFGQVPLTSLPANLVAVPVVSLVVTPLALLGVAASPLLDAAALLVGWTTAALRLLEQLPGAVWSAAAAPLALGLAAMAGGLLMVLRLPLGLRVLGLPLLLPVLLWQPPRPQPGSFEVLAVDVGQGSAVLVRTAGHVLLYDAGPGWRGQSNAGDRILVPLLRALGAPPDRVVISHSDSDHSGGAGPVLAAHPKAQVWASFDLPSPGPQRAVTRCQAGQHWSWDGVRFEVLHPQASDYEDRGRSTNALSCVLRVSAGGVAALLTGDIGRREELALLGRAAAGPIASDLLVLPHHGSQTSSSDAFLDGVHPRIALVQAGWRNRFGHPSPAVLARLRARDIVIRGTATCGAARWSSRAPDTVDCHRQASRRYWSHAPPPGEAGSP